MDVFIEVTRETIAILLDASAYILLGIVASGFIKIALNKNVIAHHLSGGKYLCVIKASFFGVPLPL